MWPPLAYGSRVKTTQLNISTQDEWTKEGLANKKWGVKGTIIAHHDSHGLCYDVLHDDGTKGCYDPSEIKIITELNK